MLDNLKLTWCNNNRNKVHNKCNELELSWKHFLPWSVEKLSSTKSVPRAIKGWGPLLHSVCVCVCVCVFLVTRSCPTLCNPMDCSPPGSSVLGDSVSKNTGGGFRSLLQGIFPIQGSNLGLLHRRQILYHLSHQGSPMYITMVIILYMTY